MPSYRRGWMTYAPDRFTDAMSIKVDEVTAANNSVALALTPPQDNYWPGHRSELRMVHGVAADGTKDSCVVADPTNALYAIGAVFVNLFGVAFTVTSLKPEYLRQRSLK